MRSGAPELRKDLSKDLSKDLRKDLSKGWRLRLWSGSVSPLLLHPPVILRVVCLACDSRLESRGSIAYCPYVAAARPFRPLSAS